MRICLRLLNLPLKLDYVHSGGGANRAETVARLGVGVSCLLLVVGR